MKQGSIYVGRECHFFQGRNDPACGWRYPHCKHRPFQMHSHGGGPDEYPDAACLCRVFSYCSQQEAWITGCLTNPSRSAKKSRCWFPNLIKWFPLSSLTWVVRSQTGWKSNLPTLITYAPWGGRGWEWARNINFPHSALLLWVVKIKQSIWFLPIFVLMKDDRSNRQAHGWKSLFPVRRSFLFLLFPVLYQRERFQSLKGGAKWVTISAGSPLLCSSLQEHRSSQLWPYRSWQSLWRWMGSSCLLSSILGRVP